MTIMTAEQAFNVAMNQYPSLYSSPSVKQSKLKYYDQIFNVVGNGYIDFEDFIKSHTVNKNNEKLINSYPNKYIGKTPLFYAYIKVEEHSGYKMGVREGSPPGIYTKEELKNMPEVVHTVRANGHNLLDEQKGFVPYPNFEKEYSMVWKMDMEKLDRSWREESLFYYKEMKKFFKGDDAPYYSDAVHKEDWEKEQAVKNYEKNFARYKEPGMSQDDFYAKISKEYELEYNGNTMDFIQRRWDKELNRINEFIDETISKIEQSLEPIKKQKMKM